MPVSTRTPAGQLQADHAPGGRQEAGGRILRVQAGLDRVSRESDLGLVDVQRLAGGDPQLIGHQVAAGDRLGHRMLDLQPGVHLQEVEATRVVEQELDRARALVADGGRHGQRGLAHAVAQRRIHGRRRATPPRSSGAVAGQSSRARPGGPRARAGRTGPGPPRGAGRPAGAPGSGDRRRRRGSPRDGRLPGHRPGRTASRTTCIPFPPPPAAGLTSSGSPTRAGFSAQRGVVLRLAVVAGQHRHTARRGSPASGRLVAHRGDRIGRRPHPRQAGLDHGAGERRVLGQEAIAGVDRFGAGATRGVQDPGTHQGRSRPA